jgi:hypothetical protein
VTPFTIEADVVAVAATASPPASARETRVVNIVDFEALGNGLIDSLDYERIYLAWNVGFRAGASFFTYKLSNATGAGNLTLATFPLVASYYFGPPRHKLQLGLGATVLYIDASSDAAGTKFGSTGLEVAATGVVGYRYLPKCRGFTFGVGFTPLFRAGKGFLPWGGVNAGIAF